MSRDSDGPLARGFSDAALLVLGSSLGALLGLASMRLLLTSFSEEDYGRYCLFLVVAGVLTVLAHWPTHGILRLGAEEFEERGAIGGAVGSAGAQILASLALVAVAVVLLRNDLDALMQTSSWGMALAFAGLSGLAQLGYVALQPVGMVRYRTLLPALAKAFYAGLLGLVVFGQGSLELSQALLLCTLSIVPVTVLPLLAIGGRLGRVRVERPTLERSFAFGWPLLLRNLGISGVLYVDILVIQAFLGPASAGRYDVAYRIAEQVIVFSFALEYVVGPVLAVAAARKAPETLRRFYRLLAPQLVWGWSLAAALLVVLAEPVLTLLGAKSPVASAEVLKVLALAVAVRGAISLEMAVFDAHLVSRLPTLFFFLGFAVNLGVDVASLSAGWGLLGPALGTILGFGLQGGLRSWLITRRFGVAAWRPYLGMTPVLVILGADFVFRGALLPGLVAWVVVVVLVVVLGRRLGLFPAEARPYLAEVRMPGVLRAGLERLYGTGGPA